MNTEEKEWSDKIMQKTAEIQKNHPELIDFERNANYHSQQKHSGHYHPKPKKVLPIALRLDR